ncbi:MAG: hypothetical protein ABI723_25905 [Bacteroidia bacterium]
MKKLLLISCILLLFQSKLFAQNEILDQSKYSECLLVIPIDYKDTEANYQESKKYTDKEIIMIQTKGNGKIKSFERGFIRNWEKNGKKGVFFEHKSVDSNQKSAYFPIFNAKNTYCYLAECYDKK